MDLKKLLILVFGILFLVSGCGKSEEQEPLEMNEPKIETKISEVESFEEEMSKLSELNFGFAFANKNGDRLITTMGVDVDQPETFNLAIGKISEEIAIKYVTYQNETSENTYRQTADNFENLGGFVYKADGFQLIPNETYALFNAEKIKPSSMIALTSTRASETSERYYQEVNQSVIEKLEDLKKRKVIHSELLAETQEGGQVCLLQFERIDDDMLFSIVYINETLMLLKDYPATYDEYSTWRADSGDEPGLFSVLFIIKTDEGVVMGMTWAAPEGENAFLLKETTDGFEELELSGSRYWSP